MPFIIRLGHRPSECLDRLKQSQPHKCSHLRLLSRCAKSDIHFYQSDHLVVQVLRPRVFQEVQHTVLSLNGLSMEQYCLLAKGARGLALADLIQRVTSDPQIFAFGELLSMQQVQEVMAHCTGMHTFVHLRSSQRMQVFSCERYDCVH